MNEYEMYQEDFKFSTFMSQKTLKNKKKSEDSEEQEESNFQNPKILKGKQAKRLESQQQSINQGSNTVNQFKCRQTSASRDLRDNSKTKTLINFSKNHISQKNIHMLLKQQESPYQTKQSKISYNKQHLQSQPIFNQKLINNNSYSQIPVIKDIKDNFQQEDIENIKKFKENNIQSLLQQYQNEQMIQQNQKDIKDNQDMDKQFNIQSMLQKYQDEQKLQDIIQLQKLELEQHRQVIQQKNDQQQQFMMIQQQLGQQNQMMMMFQQQQSQALQQNMQKPNQYIQQPVIQPMQQIQPIIQQPIQQIIQQPIQTSTVNPAQLTYLQTQQLIEQQLAKQKNLKNKLKNTKQIKKTINNFESNEPSNFEESIIQSLNRKQSKSSLDRTLLSKWNKNEIENSKIYKIINSQSNSNEKSITVNKNESVQEFNVSKLQQATVPKKAIFIDFTEKRDDKKSLQELWNQKRKQQDGENKKKDNNISRKSSQDLIRIRKQMMKSKNSKNNFEKIPENIPEPKKASKSQGKQIPEQLLNRLINGQQVKVGRNEMLKLTKKNYNNLPEVKEKRLKEIKEAEQRERAQVKKEIMQDQRRKSRFNRN